MSFLHIVEFPNCDRRAAPLGAVEDEKGQYNENN